METRPTLAFLLLLTSPLACADKAPTEEAETRETAPVASATTGEDPPDDSAGANDTTSTTDDGEPASSSGAGPAFIYDVAGIPDVPGSGNCGAPNPVHCDDEDDDPWHAIGLNCNGGPQVNGVYNGDPDSLHVHEGELGTFSPPPFPPREGDKMLILSSGIATDLLIPNGNAAADITGYIDNGSELPEPIVVDKVDEVETCADNPSLIGEGDCSNTIYDQWTQGNLAYDYNELRMEVQVPANTTGFSYDLAMFSTEYPVYYQSQFNDMYIAWLESETWTGNISFDEAGNPISLNAGFLDYKDAPNPYDCPAPCVAPELEGTAMVGHAGTKWLTTTASVLPLEDITLVFAVFDLSDPVLDTVILLDNWMWNCGGGPPVTVPG